MTRPNPPVDAIVADLMLAVGQLVRRLRSEAHPGDLNLSQSSALARLEREGAMTTADLARAEAMKPQSMKAVLATLEEAGCVERKPHPTDGRQILFVATAKGLETRSRTRAAKRAWLVDHLAQFNDADINALATAIPIIRRLGETSTDGAAPAGVLPDSPLDSPPDSVPDSVPDSSPGLPPNVPSGPQRRGRA